MHSNAGLRSEYVSLFSFSYCSLALTFLVCILHVWLLMTIKKNTNHVFQFVEVLLNYPCTKKFSQCNFTCKKKRRACLNNSRTVLQLKEICVCVYTTLKWSKILNITHVDWNIKNGYFALFDLIIEGLELYANSNTFLIKGGNVLNLKLTQFIIH